MGRILNIKEAAEKLSLKVSTLYSWVHRKRIPYVKIGEKLGFLEEKLDEYINLNSYIPE